MYCVSTPKREISDTLRGLLSGGSVWLREFALACGVRRWLSVVAMGGLSTTATAVVTIELSPGTSVMDPVARTSRVRPTSLRLIHLIPLSP